MDSYEVSVFLYVSPIPVEEDADVGGNLRV